jgi:4-amino-4-deoxychorismate lyase
LLSSKLLSGDLLICSQQVSINENLAGLKHLNRLENVLARNEWTDADITVIDGLMLNADGFVIEGTMSNLFAVKGGQLFTPRLHRSGVKGVMREHIIAIARESDIAVSFIDIRPEQLADMDELFISNSLIGIKSINNLRETCYRQTDVTKLVFEKTLCALNDHVKII